jgi:hypothetical protein
MTHKFEDLLEKIKEKHSNVKLITFESSENRPKHIRHEDLFLLVLGHRLHNLLRS